MILFLIWFFYTWFVASVSIMMYKKYFTVEETGIGAKKQRIRRKNYEMNLPMN
jgi:hypothetical protein